jgi:HEAT repeat protein
MGDADSHVRMAACEAWGHRGDGQGVALLAEALHGDVDADVRSAATKALGDTKGPQTVAALTEALDDPDPAMQYRAVTSLEMSTGKNLSGNVERWRQYLKETKQP